MKDLARMNGPPSVDAKSRLGDQTPPIANLIAEVRN